MSPGRTAQDLRRSIPGLARESRWEAGDGCSIRRIDWPRPVGSTKGSILFLPGRGDFYEKYLEVLSHWHSEGWQVCASDWRGQGGSGRLGRDAVTGHIDDFSTWVEDLGTLWRQWKTQAPAPHVLVGHSMGGHLALRTVAEKQADPAALILSAPMLGLAGGNLPVSIMHFAVKAMKSLDDSRRPAWKWSEVPGEVSDQREHLLTHDRDRYEDELFWRKARPEVVMGPGSWGWLERAYASIRLLAQQGVLEAVTVPTLILATDQDRLVSWKAIVRAAARLADCELVHFGAEARHEILRESDPARLRALAACTAFLARLSPG